MKLLIALMFLLSVANACNKKGQVSSDKLYSRHLQRQVDLSIYHTKIPDDRSELQLLILNDAADLPQVHAFETIDSLFKAGIIGPTVAVAVHAGDRLQEYGVAGKPDFDKRGSKADHYDAFITNELLSYIRKKTETRKFRNIAIAGWSLGGLSAFDIGWNHPDKFDVVGVFSGSFWWRDKDLSDSTYSDELNRIMISKLKASRKTPGSRFWFYAGTGEETSDRDNDKIIDVVDDTKDLINTMISKRKVNPSNITYVEAPGAKHDQAAWARQFPAFITFALHR